MQLLSTFMRIVVPVVNNPLFLHLQVEGLRTYMPSEIVYEVVVFNDAKAFPDATNYGDLHMRQRITDTCSELGIRCIPVENSHHQHIPSASHRHADTLRFIMKLAIDESWGPVLMLDSDMFPVCDMGPILNAYAGAAAGAFAVSSRGSLRYLWPNLFFLNLGRAEVLHLELLSWDVTLGCDSGGASSTWLSIQEASGPGRIRWIQHLSSCQWGPAELADLPVLSEPLRDFLREDVRNQGDRFWAELYDGCFLHYRAGSNWNSEGAHVHTSMSERLATAYRRHISDRVH